MITRIHSLDYLRGLAALGIMIYHYLSWTLGDFESETVLGRIGLYGVSIFYILSGLTLYHVYKDRLTPKWKDIKTFYLKRILRIFPLLWLVTIATIFIYKSNPYWLDVFYNLSGLFGILKWDAYIATGAWSIGNELSFYLFFPIYLFFLNFNRAFALVLSLIVLGVYIFFAFGIFDTNQTLSENWSDYVNPLNQLFLFMSGILIGYFFSNLKGTNWTFVFFLLAGILLFVWYPATGNTIHIISGFNRLVFTFSCLIICFAFFKIHWNLPTLVHKPLKLLGNASYSVYLLHPILYGIVGFGNDYLKISGSGFSETIRLILSFVSTLVVSYVVYTYFEKYFMRLGKSTQVVKNEEQSKTKG